MSSSDSYGSSSAVVIIDPLSAGKVVEKRLLDERVIVIRVFSDDLPDEYKKIPAPPGHSLDVFLAIIEHKTIDETMQRIEKLEMPSLAIICGSDYGVPLYIELTNALQKTSKYATLRGSGLSNVDLAVNKYVQAEAVRQHGLDAVKQRILSTDEELEAFLQVEKDDMKAVVKPNRGGGSFGVSLCSSKADVRRAFRKLKDEADAEHGVNADQILVQEFLEGTEYTVDTVSMDGSHKCVLTCKYDKRPYNGSQFVYYGMHLVDSGSDSNVPAVIAYTLCCLDAIGFLNGAVHSEVMLTSRGPVLIEANCRLAGIDGLWVPLAEAALGYSAVSALLDVSLRNGNEFKRLPERPASHYAIAGVVAFLRTSQEGIVKEVNVDELKGLASYHEPLIFLERGDEAHKTTDLDSCPGLITLVNENDEALEQDYQQFHAACDRGKVIVLADAP
jgi:hypothetical protein